MDRRGFLRASAWTTGGFIGIPLLNACGGADPVSAGNAYFQTNLAASTAAYGATFLIPDMVDAWGIAIRPAGAGGHFWITASANSYEFVGDVDGTPIAVDPQLGVVALPPAPDGNTGSANGIFFNSTGKGLVITQTLPSGESVTAPAKFVFVSDNAVLSAWTQLAGADGSLQYPDHALKILDDSANGSAFFGLAASPTFDKLYVADFGNNPHPRIRVFDDAFQEEALNGRFTNPFIPAGSFTPGDYAPWGIHTIEIGTTFSVFVAYVNTSEDPDDPGTVLFATENTGRGLGRLVEYTADGQFVAIWNDNGTLNGPWGVALAPGVFGPFSNHLLVGNFTDGTIVAFDTATKTAKEFVRDTAGNVTVVPGIWGMLFGNGVKLGDTNALYFAAGPADETEGLFGSLRFAG